MSTEAQVAANQANAQNSTGPKSADGKAAICWNAFRHGLTGTFRMLEDENQEDFDELYDGLRTEHQPGTPTEVLLVESVAQHYWLMQRAMRLQTLCFDMEAAEGEKKLALFLRYQTTHERAFYKSLNTLLKLRADTKRQEIGFVSQEMKQSRAREQAERERERAESKLSRARQQAERERERAQRQTEEHARKQAIEKRKQEVHKWKVLYAQAEADHRIMLNMNLQTPENRTTIGPQHIIAAEKAA